LRNFTALVDEGDPAKGYRGSFSESMSEYGQDHTMNAEQEASLRLLRAAVNPEIPDDVETAVCAAYEAGLHTDFVPSFIHLLSLDWHTRHEDITLALQELKDPRAVEVLSVTALREFPYLDYDEFRGLARKCTWALADIGTPEAKQKLQELSASGDPLIAQYAQKRLDRWHHELHRKNGGQGGGGGPVPA
jgi:hypothetical protein